MSVIQRGLRSSARSKAVVGRLRGLGAAPLLPPRPAEAPPAAPAPAVPGPAAPHLAAPLPPDLHAAAERLAELFAAAAFETWTRSPWTQGGPAGDAPCDPLDPTPEALLARTRYRAAMRAVPVLLSPLVVHVCCLGLPLGQWAAERNIPRPQADRALRTALTHLLNHFRAQI